MTITRDDPRFWDVRTLERRMRKGQITKKDVVKHVQGLPDVEEKKASISPTESLDDAVDDDDDFDDDLDEDDEDDAEKVDAAAGDAEDEGGQTAAGDSDDLDKE
jgi:hypothetical protein